MSTMSNYLCALEAEARNHELYLLFAAQADAEGNRQLARMFRATAESELVHARAQVAEMGLVGSSRENLRYAIAAEEQEFQDSYARYLREAKAEGDKRAAELFGRFLEVERAHHKMFTSVLAAVDASEPLPDAPVHVCQECGNTVIGQRPDGANSAASPASSSWK